MHSIIRFGSFKFLINSGLPKKKTGNTWNLRNLVKYLFEQESLKNQGKPEILNIFFTFK